MIIVVMIMVIVVAVTMVAMIVVIVLMPCLCGWVGMGMLVIMLMISVLTGCWHTLLPRVSVAGLFVAGSFWCGLSHGEIIAVVGQIAAHMIQMIERLAKERADVG